MAKDLQPTPADRLFNNLEERNSKSTDPERLRNIVEHTPQQTAHGVAYTLSSMVSLTRSVVENYPRTGTSRLCRQLIMEEVRASGITGSEFPDALGGVLNQLRSTLGEEFGKYYPDDVFELPSQLAKVKGFKPKFGTGK